MIAIKRKVFFDMVRADPFPGALNQSQVDGMTALLDMWQEGYPNKDQRWLAYCLATTMWETSSTMQPIEEYGKGEGMSYGVADKETGETYYGRGFVQLTWRDNYARADKELGLADSDESLEWHAGFALDPEIAADVLYIGCIEGWFRTHEDGKPETLGRYFNDDTDDPYNAREIINGDKSKVPSWAAGAHIGDLIAGYHRSFLAAIEASTKILVADLTQDEGDLELKPIPPGAQAILDKGKKS
jgi:hypothetical protein